MWLVILEYVIALPSSDNYKKLLRSPIINSCLNQYQEYFSHSINSQYYLTYYVLSNS